MAEALYLTQGSRRQAYMFRARSRWVRLGRDLNPLERELLPMYRFSTLDPSTLSDPAVQGDETPAEMRQWLQHFIHPSYERSHPGTQASVCQMIGWLLKWPGENVPRLHGTTPFLVFPLGTVPGRHLRPRGTEKILIATAV